MKFKAGISLRGPGGSVTTHLIDPVTKQDMIFDSDKEESTISLFKKIIDSLPVQWEHGLIGFHIYLDSE